jgi:repressor LexA
MDMLDNALPKRNHPTWQPSLEPLDPADELAVALPLLGLVSAGQPVVAVEAEETIQVPARLVRRHAAERSFALCVRGDSMTEDRIEDGDIVIVEQRPTAENGETVVARIDGYQVTLKRFYREPDGIRLQPANDALEPLRFEGGEIEILGVVSGVVAMRR